jgi:hypothetical protein
VQAYDRLYTPRVIRLNPCGDIVIVLLQSRETAEYIVWIYMRTSFRTGTSPKTGFYIGRILKLDDAIQETATPVVEPVFNEQGTNHFEMQRRQIRSTPTATIFSPCGRFLIFCFAKNQSFHPFLTGCQPGFLIMDLSEIWSDILSPVVATPESCNDNHSRWVAWIDCRSDLIPTKVAWNDAGLWLLTPRSGVLLLSL